MGGYSGFLIIFLIQYSSGAMPVYRDDMTAPECASKIIQKIKLTDTRNIVLVNANASLAKYLYAMLDGVRFVSRSFYWPKNSLINDIYIIQCSNSSILLHGLDLLKRDTMWNPTAKFVIIIENVEDLNVASDYLVQHYIYDVALIVSDQVYTFGLERDECNRPVDKLFQLTHCSKVQTIDNVYAQTRNLRGCHVKFVTHDLGPFVYLDPRHSPDAGIEPYILELIAEYENITVQLIEYDDELGEMLDNFTYTGMLHEIEIGNVEGAMGGFSILNSNRVKNLDFVYPFMDDHYVIVTARAKVLSSWCSVLKQLGEHTIWGVVVTYCATCLIVIWMGVFQKRVKDNVQDILIVWGYFFNNIVQKKNIKTGIPYRMVLLNTLLFVFLISCTTQACLFSAITKPMRGYQATTVDEVTSKYQLIMSPHAYEHIQNDPSTHFNIDHDIFCNETDECLLILIRNKDKHLYTISANMHQKMIFIYDDYTGENDVHTINEAMACIYYTMYLRRGSFLVEPFNRLILNARSAGLIDRYFVRQQQYFRIDLEYFLHNVTSVSSKQKPLSLETMNGVYIVLISMYCTSAIVFVAEISHERFCLMQDESKKKLY